MSPALLLAALLALASSAAINGGFLLQARGGRHAPVISPRHPVRTLRGLLGSRLWLVGQGLGCAGWALFVWALSMGPLSIVQAFSAGGLALVVPIAASLTGHPLSAAEGRAIPVVAAGLALLALATHSAGSDVGDAGTLAGLLVALAAIAGLLIAAPRRRSDGVALGAAAGVLYGAADVATKAATSSTDAALVVWIAVAGVLTLGAFFAFQRGLQCGSAVVAIATMATLTSVVAVTSGIVAFAEPLGTTPLLAVVRLVGLVIAAWGGLRLSAAQARIEGVVPAGGGPSPT